MLLRFMVVSILLGTLQCVASGFRAEVERKETEVSWETTVSAQWKPDSQWLSEIRERDGRAYRDRIKEVYGTPPAYRPVVPPSKSRYLLFDPSARPYEPITSPEPSA